jgi:hypothetical protein
MRKENYLSLLKEGAVTSCLLMIDEIRVEFDVVIGFYLLREMLFSADA